MNEAFLDGEQPHLDLKSLKSAEPLGRPLQSGEISTNTSIPEEFSPSAETQVPNQKRYQTKVTPKVTMFNAQ